MFTIALLASEFGQVWAKLGLRKSHTTSGETLGLHNCAVADKRSNDEYYGDFPDITCRGKPYLAIVQLQTKDLGKSGITKIAYDYTTV